MRKPSLQQPYDLEDECDPSNVQIPHDLEQAILERLEGQKLRDVIESRGSRRPRGPPNNPEELETGRHYLVEPRNMGGSKVLSSNSNGAEGTLEQRMTYHLVESRRSKVPANNPGGSRAKDCTT